MHPVTRPDTPLDADTSFQGVSHLGAKGQFVFSRIPNSIQVTFAWTSTTDVGPLPDYIIEYIVQYFPRYCMVDLDRFVLPFYTKYRRILITVMVNSLRGMIGQCFDGVKNNGLAIATVLRTQWMWPTWTMKSMRTSMTMPQQRS